MGKELKVDEMYCSACAAAIKKAAEICVHCGVRVKRGDGQTEKRSKTSTDRSKTVAALLAIFLGWLGLHKFYTGKIMWGVIYLSVSVVGSFFTFGLTLLLIAFVSFIEGIGYLGSSDEAFQKHCGSK